MQQKIGEIHTLTVRFPQIFNPFRAKNSDFFGKIPLFFLDLLKFPPLQCIHQKVHPDSAFLLSWKTHYFFFKYLKCACLFEFISLRACY